MVVTSREIEGALAHAPGPRVLAQRQRRRGLVRVGALLLVLVLGGGVTAMALRGGSASQLSVSGGRERAAAPAAPAEPPAPAEPAPEPAAVPEVEAPRQLTRPEKPAEPPSRAVARAERPKVPEVAAVAPQRPDTLEVLRNARDAAALMVPLLPLAIPPPPPPMVATQPLPPPAVEPAPAAPPPPAPMIAAAPPPGPTVTTVWLEAEQAALTPPMQAQDVPEASGQAIGVPEGTDPAGAGAELRFAVPEGGTYVLWGRVAPGGDPEALTVALDGEEPETWRVDDAGDGWTWRALAYPTQLDSGDHTLRIGARRAGAFVDTVILSDDLAFTPDGTPPPWLDLELRIEVENGEARFTVPVAGEYRVEAWVAALERDPGELRVRLEGEEVELVEFGEPFTWSWWELFDDVQLEAGEHTLRFEGDDDIELGQVLVTDAD